MSLFLSAIMIAISLFEDNDQVWCFFQVLLLPGGLQRFEVFHPCFTHSFGVVYFLFSFYNQTNLFFHFRVWNDNVGPRFCVSSTWCSAWNQRKRTLLKRMSQSSVVESAIDVHIQVLTKKHFFMIYYKYFLNTASGLIITKK